MKFLVDGSFQLRKKNISFIIESGLKSEEVSAKKRIGVRAAHVDVIFLLSRN